MQVHGTAPVARILMNVLVTGGAGFIGSHVVDAAVTAGHVVTVVDRVAPRHRNRHARYVLGDVTDVECWSAVLDGVEAVCHQAARVGLGVDFADVGDYVRDNDAGTAAGLLAMHRVGFEGRIVLAGSMVVYGEGRYRCRDHGVVRPGPRPVERLAAGMFDPACPQCGATLAPEAVTEDAHLDPRNVYAATKLHQEHLVAAYAREHAASAVSLRYHNVYGPRMPRDTPYAGVASIFASALARRQPPLVFEDGAQSRDFVHVTDVARANLAALTSPVEGFVACNVASGERRTVGDLAMAMSDAAGGGVRPRITRRWRLGDVRHVFASPARARDLLGWSATKTFDDGVAERWWAADAD
jgi:dTDP-L-rhamnose 4-epimerase